MAPRGGGRGGGGGGGNHGPNQPRDVTVSKAFSWLLRHGAAREKIAMDAQGYVNVADLLAWQKVRALKVEMAEVGNVVAGNEKGRFGLLWIGNGEGKNEREVSESSEDSKLNGPTQRALAALSAGDLEPRHYLIRAAQGHSIKTITSESYLNPITLTDPATIPSTVVHGTFYAAWPRILASGGLKPMSRMHIHFATGPALDEVVPKDDGKNEADKGDAVISGMRADAQVLIYIDIHKALAAGVLFWRSENGVILTEGVAGNEGDGVKMLPIDFWDVVVETKAGLGHLWRSKVGVVKELPEELRNDGMPRGKERGGKGGGKGGAGARPKLVVERGEVD